MSQFTYRMGDVGAGVCGTNIIYRTVNVFHSVPCQNY